MTSTTTVKSIYHDTEARAIASHGDTYNDRSDNNTTNYSTPGGYTNSANGTHIGKEANTFNFHLSGELARNNHSHERIMDGYQLTDDTI